MGTSTSELVDIFNQFFNTHYTEKVAELAEGYPDEKRSLVIRYDDLSQFDSELAEDFRSQPTQIREYAEEALRMADHSSGVKLGDITVRLSGLPKTHALQDIRSRHVGRFIQIQGTVASASTVRSLFTDVSLECQRCGTVNYIPQQEPSTAESTDEPHECQGCERQGPFRINHDQSELVDAQTIVVEQQIRGDGSGDDIETIEVRLSDDLVSRAGVGDTVVLTGVLRLSENPSETTVTDKHLDAHHIESADPHAYVDINQSDVNRFIEISESDTLYEDIIGSIAPTIKGYEEEKLALALQLFGGIEKDLPDGSTVRGDIHVLLMGDPGTSKSPLLRAAARLAPRAVTISGTDTTPVGLTAAATPSSGDADPWEIKGGALVKANEGLAVIDNLGGFGDSHFEGLHSALEQQDIDVSKATVTKTLPAKTSVLAASNPKYGRFDIYEPLGEQMDIPVRLIPQFDLIFLMRDDPDPDWDREVAGHITDKHHLGEIEAKQTGFSESTTREDDVTEAASDLSPVIDNETLRKYIVHARQSCFPELTEEAKDIMAEFYVDVRSNDGEDAPAIPVTARKIEAIVRLAEASARMRLSDTIKVEDAERAVDIVRSCLDDIGITPEKGMFDDAVTEPAMSAETRQKLSAASELVEEATDENPSLSDVVNQANEEDKDVQEVKQALETKVKQLISGIEEDHEEGAPIEKVVGQHAEIGLNAASVEELIERLRRKGQVYEPKQDHLRTV